MHGFFRGLLITIVGFVVLLLFSKGVLAASCGNAVCQPSLGENCSTCSADCGCTTGYSCSAGVCAPNTPVPTSTPNPTSTPVPSGTPGPTPTGSGGGSTRSTPSTTIANYAPTLVLFNFPSGNTNLRALYFSGVAYADEGEIVSVEYSTNGGSGWISANSTHGKFDQGSEAFSFTTAELTEGPHDVRIRTKTSLGHTTETTRSTVIVITPPVVLLDKIGPNPTGNKKPVISGVATSASGSISSVDVSLDGGVTWVTVGSGGRFIFSTELEDGNYQVIARAVDSGGNIGTSTTQTLIVDTIPPMIGGAVVSIGPRILHPNSDGAIVLVQGVKATLSVSMKGGVTAAKIITDNGTFEMKSSGEHLWVGDLNFSSPGVKKISIYAEDGAGNKFERSYGSFVIEPNGKVISENSEPIKGANVTVYVFNSTSQSWGVWDGGAYGQKNPQNVNDKGEYDFMVPPGRYHTLVTAPGFFSKESTIVQNTDSFSLSIDVTLKSKPGFGFKLPFLGDIFLGFPSFFPPENFELSLPSPPKYVNDFVGKKAPNISLSGLEGASVRIPQLGKKEIISFISTWSSSSLEEATILSDVTSGLSSDQSLQVIALQDSPAEVLSLISRGTYNFSIFPDNNGESAASFGVTTLPYNVFIDSTGVIRGVIPGIMSRNMILEKLGGLR